MEDHKAQLIAKYKEWYKDTPFEWKIAVIEKCQKENIMYIDTSEDIDMLYDECIDWLTYKTYRRLTNLAKKEGYAEPPCHVCKMMILHWKKRDDIKWNPDNAHKFEAINSPVNQ
jgi:hypothetical protein